MKVVALLHAYLPDHGAGAEHHAHTLLSALADRGHDVSVVLSREATWQGDHTWQVGPVQVDGHADKVTLHRHLSGADILVTHLENTARAHAIGKRRKLWTVDLLHNTFPPTVSWLGRDRCDLAIANSEWMARTYTGRSSGVPVRVMRPLTPVADYATKPGPLVTLSNLYVNKGPHVLWAVAKLLPDVKFLAVKGAYGPQEIPQQVPSNVRLMDNTPQVRDRILARTRIQLMPSGYESWGRMAVEAMCAGIPVIAHPTPGLVESLGPAGVFADRDDPEAWAAAIRWLSDPATWKQQSAAAKARAVELEAVARADVDDACAAIEELPQLRTMDKKVRRVHSR